MIRTSFALPSLFFLLPATVCAQPDEPAETFVPIRALTSGEAHWFGYYDKHQFDPSGHYILGMETAFEDRSPEPTDTIRLGMVDTHDGDTWIPFAESSAWNWQQGCMLQWLPGSGEDVIYNDRRDGRFVSVIRNPFTGVERVIPHPIYAVAPDGKSAVTTNFVRLDTTRPGYGYAADGELKHPIPEDDGVYRVDLETGEATLLFTYGTIVTVEPQDSMADSTHWFNHLLYSPEGSRFIFLHRWRESSLRSGPWSTRMLTATPSGNDPHVVADHGMVSHFIWRDPDRILAWSREPDTGNRFHLYVDQTDAVKVVGEDILTQDGHCTYSPDGEWILTDTYPDRERMQTLMLYRPADKRLVKLGRFHMPRVKKAEFRCDLHPRWSRDGRYVCIDSKHTGRRQMYLLDVSEIVGH